MLVLTEHMLQETHPPSWVDQVGSEMYITLGKIKKSPHGSTHIGGVTIIIRKYTVTSTVIAKTSQLATCWTISSPHWDKTLHITGAYCSPNSRSDKATTFQHTTEIFNKLTQHNLLRKLRMTCTFSVAILIVIRVNVLKNTSLKKREKTFLFDKVTQTCNITPPPLNHKLHM